MNDSFKFMSTASWPTCLGNLIYMYWHASHRRPTEVFFLSDRIHSSQDPYPLCTSYPCKIGQVKGDFQLLDGLVVHPVKSQFLPSPSTCIVCSISLFRALANGNDSLLVPLVGAAVLWTSNGRFPIGFIDSLYISVSGATGTGLVTVDLSALTAWQQAILVILELVGNQVCIISL